MELGAGRIRFDLLRLLRYPIEMLHALPNPALVALDPVVKRIARGPIADPWAVWVREKKVELGSTVDTRISGRAPNLYAS